MNDGMGNSVETQRRKVTFEMYGTFSARPLFETQLFIGETLGEERKSLFRNRFILSPLLFLSGYLDDKRSLDERMARLANGTAEATEAPAGNDRLLQHVLPHIPKFSFCMIP